MLRRIRPCPEPHSEHLLPEKRKHNGKTPGASKFVTLLLSPETLLSPFERSPMAEANWRASHQSGIRQKQRKLSLLPKVNPELPKVQ
jgi:hypothetical protein